MDAKNNSAIARELLPGTRRALAVTCPRCGAEPGRACHTPNGNGTLPSVVHGGRRDAASQNASAQP